MTMRLYKYDILLKSQILTTDGNSFNVKKNFKTIMLIFFNKQIILLHYFKNHNKHNQLQS